VLGLIVLRLTFRWRWRTVLIGAVVLALVGDFAVDMLVTVGNR
jgi:hypothetical protein